MAKSSSAGGGINSNKLVRPPVRDGKPAMGVRPGYVDTLGNMRGNHATEVGRALNNTTPMQTVKPPISVPLGNELATNVGAGGPGTGRKVMATGTQGQYGKSDPGNRPTGKVDVGSRAILGRPGQKV